MQKTGPRKSNQGKGAMENQYTHCLPINEQEAIVYSTMLKEKKKQPVNFPGFANRGSYNWISM